ncbi:bacteriophage abortive infection AbiH family protein [Flectobacillus roseus]|uniref:Bacteriophage abortive infection AbiH family protein n=1 Tax=Flectobacillus roseus TaxID=502259 RepID=A0ABT6Y320_9BACT|nr:bacteriophage abortive infection AbiH family protein [Flectobacillus roseus]MDI9857950.1 bacteriophage abortive infection AbiH family protein [Flectobacillus roseus]
MTIKKLYIIGNGFDIQHGLKSRYWDFIEYLDNTDKQLVEKLEEYFGGDALWSDFEETLAYLNTEQIVDECMDYLQPYSAEDWSDAYNHDYRYEVQQRINLITDTLKKRFTEWILQLRLPNKANENMVVVDKNAKFINFNYTDTLERLYKVAQEKIFYIHNKAVDTNSTLILGHSRNPQNAKKLDELYNDEDTDVRVAEGNRILDDYFIETYKSTETIITENSDFFDSLKYLETIYVFGHSLSVVDRPYFLEIIKRIDKDKVTWKVSFHNKKNLIDFQAFFQGLDISSALVEFDRMYNFDKTQLKLFGNNNKN